MFILKIKVQCTTFSVNAGFNLGNVKLNEFWSKKHSISSDNLNELNQRVS